MKKLLLAVLAAGVLFTMTGCMGYYHEGKCEYQYLLHKDLSVAKWIGHATGGC